ncbi:hypothetical protein L1D14_04285 [Vibrio tubiashii]|uniref:hypothetical protein n=1 Tax=Vibrio tubiashii TaxID=29498 RepID=UPI001EFDCB79|nr:hypothetical protein [Vibrio tubiashii]MCG9575450.1 hypothetical protein [Vibrio tubiashii]
MLEKNKIQCLFKDVPVKQVFYTARFHGETPSVDSISLTKLNKTEAKSFEWPKDTIHPDQPCWYFESK